jgi:hypothetical protein
VHPSPAFEWVNYTLVRCPWQYTKKVLICRTGVLKFTVAKTIILLYNSTIEIEKDKKMTALTREETIALIVTHMLEQGIEHPEQFEDFCQELQTMSQAELDEQLAIVEELAIYGSTMPRF